VLAAASRCCSGAGCGVPVARAGGIEWICEGKDGGCNTQRADCDAALAEARKACADKATARKLAGVATEAAKALDMLTADSTFHSASALPAVEDLMGEEIEAPDVFGKTPSKGNLDCIVLALKDQDGKPQAAPPATSSAPSRSPKDILATLVAAWVASTALMVSVVTMVTHFRASLARRRRVQLTGTEMAQV